MQNNSRRHKSLSFSQWFKYILGSVKREFAVEIIPGGYWWDEMKHPQEAVAHLTHLFVNIDSCTAPLSNKDCANLLKYLINLAFSGYMAILMDFDNGVDMEDRITCIKSIRFVYEKLFAQRCPPQPVLGNPSHNNPLAIECFMWWDVIGLYGHPNDERFTRVDETILEVMENILYMESDSCRESGLHGLNEWTIFYPQRIRAIIQEFLSSNPDLNPRLVDYAIKAQDGMLP